MSWGPPSRERLPVVDGAIARVPLTRGAVALIDACDAELVGMHRWHASPEHYATRNLTVDGRRCKVKMHRFILDVVGSDLVDHINHDTLDNRRENLRIATALDNKRNLATLPSHNTTGYLGISRSGRVGWKAMVRVLGRTHHVGSFPTAIEAAYARDEWLRANCPSEFWTFNFPMFPGERGVATERKSA